MGDWDATLYGWPRGWLVVEFTRTTSGHSSLSDVRVLEDGLPLVLATQLVDLVAVLSCVALGRRVLHGRWDIQPRAGLDPVLDVRPWDIQARAGPHREPNVLPADLQPRVEASPDLGVRTR